MLAFFRIKKGGREKKYFQVSFLAKGFWHFLVTAQTIKLYMIIALTFWVFFTKHEEKDLERAEREVGRKPIDPSYVKKEMWKTHFGF